MKIIDRKEAIDKLVKHDYEYLIEKFKQDKDLLIEYVLKNGTNEWINKGNTTLKKQLNVWCPEEAPYKVIDVPR